MTGYVILPIHCIADIRVKRANRFGDEKDAGSAAAVLCELHAHQVQLQKQGVRQSPEVLRRFSLVVRRAGKG